MTDKLIERIKELSNPTAIGLDTDFSYLPDEMKKNCKTLGDAAKAIREFNFRLIDRLCGIVPAVKVQVAYYEMYGVEGMEVFRDTLDYANKKGLIVISDIKRNDIGSTAGCYSKAYLGSVNINGNEFSPFKSDYITVNGYLGSDGILPFVDDAKQNDRGMFVLVKTSNPSGAEIQDRVFKEGDTLYEAMAALVESWGKGSVGKYGYSDVGAVVGATHPRQAEILRRKMPHTFFLIPGYGAQGGGADGLSVCFDENGLGGIVNNSRGILLAYRNDKYKGLSFTDAAYEAAVFMQQDIYGALKRAGKVK